MFRILVCPNITFSRDLEKDSYVIVLGNIIRELNKIRDDLEWVILSPTIIQSLIFPNTEQRIINIPSYPNSMRLHFNFFELMKKIVWKIESYDIVFSHLPEQVLAWKNLFYNTTNERPIFIGYSHWAEFPEITSYNKTVLDYWILGLLEMIRCGINTQAQKNMVIESAKKHFNSNVINELEKIVQPIYLGAETPNYTPQPIEKIIVSFALIFTLSIL